MVSTIMAAIFTYGPAVAVSIKKACGKKEEKPNILNYKKISSFWDDQQKGKFCECQYVNLCGTLSQFSPMLIGNPKDKADIHRKMRRSLKGQKVAHNIDALLAYSSGQTIWCPTFNTDYIFLGFYQAIVRNSIPIFVERTYYDTIKGNIFKNNPFVSDIVIQGKLNIIKTNLKNQIPKSDIFIPEVIDKTHQIYGIFVDGIGDKNTFIKYEDETKYLDGDIGITVNFNEQEQYISRFVDISDYTYFQEQKNALKIDRNNLFPNSKIICEFDMMDKIFLDQSISVDDLYRDIMKQAIKE